MQRQIIEYGIGYSVSAPTEAYAFTADAEWRPDSAYGSICVHGHNGNAAQWFLQAYPTLQPYLADKFRALAAPGRPVISIDAAGFAAFGNDAEIARITDGLAFLSSHYGVRSDKYHLVGFSMGGLGVLNWAARNPTKVLDLTLFMPGVDLAVLYAEGFGTEIDAAYGGHAAYLAALATHSPVNEVNDLKNFPMKCWRADNDTVAVTSSIDGFMAQMLNADPTVSLGTVGHDPSTIDPDEVMFWTLQSELVDHLYPGATVFPGSTTFPR